MASFKITMSMLWELKKCDKNPLFDILPKFILWAKTDGGCWWWIKGEARKCLKRKIVCYYGSITRIKKEEFAVMEIPFTEYPITKSKMKYSIKDYYDFKDLLTEEWLKFINQDEDAKKMINRNYDNMTDPWF